MGIDENELPSGRRLLPECDCLFETKYRGTVASPGWSNDPELLPLVMAGGWNASNEHDRDCCAMQSITPAILDCFIPMGRRS